MARRQMSLMFLGTASGGGPSDTRNCSSLICDFVAHDDLWLVDCAEGTIRQFANQPQQGFRYKAHRVNKMFITHLHADHIMGIVPFLRGVLGIPEAGATPAYSSIPTTPKLEIYGPAGLRTFVRQIMKMTFTSTAETYAVHELLHTGDVATPCDLPESPKFDQNISDQNVMHVSETPGTDIWADKDGFWREITGDMGKNSNHSERSEVLVDAGPIQHRAPCLGYVFRETGPSTRKVVILGDTHDPSEIAPLCMNPSPVLLIHEATDAPIPSNADSEGRISKRDPAEVQRKAILRGHSTPGMAGAFAKEIDASALVLNHIGGRFPAPNSKNPNEPRATIMREIERQATEAWGAGRPAVAATDFLRVDIPVLGIATYSRMQQQGSAGYHGQQNRRPQYEPRAADTRHSQQPYQG
ncbi:beta-lactamase-like protein [Ephemerocybe angulata]|uniref:Beta-lactamase-like protein n=1 Tax=Ephemerocybe angulata TaxID=980116 RepID=A0A8H6IIM0_9AGAR|nr:beta-lactamase-like protein [Tulosesus angulatus]